IATRSLPVGAISSLSGSAVAGPDIVIVTPTISQQTHAKTRSTMTFPPCRDNDRDFPHPKDGIVPRLNGSVPLFFVMRSTSLPNAASEGLDKGHHPFALVHVGKGTAHRPRIVGHVTGVGRAGNNRSDARIAQQILEKELSPTAGKFAGPVGKLLAVDRAKQS